jgi:hypothetical protein
MKRILYIIAAALVMLPMASFGLSELRFPHADPVFEAIHRGDRQTVLNGLTQGYNANTRGIPGHTAVSYAAQCRRLQILQDLVEHGGKITFHSVRCSRRSMPHDIGWNYVGPSRPLGNTFAYLFWEKGYFWRLIPIPMIVLAIIVIVVVTVRRRLKKKANKELESIDA